MEKTFMAHKVKARPASAPKVRLLIPVPSDTGDFYLSGSGHLCARTPIVHVVVDEPVVDGRGRLIGRATEADIAAFGQILAPGMSAVIVELD